MAEAKKTTKKSASKKPRIKDANKKAENTAEPKPVDTELVKTEDKPVSKAGKRSPKAIKEMAEKIAKEERKAATTADAEDKPKITTPKKLARSRVERKSKTYRELSKLIEKGKEYSLDEAVELALKTGKANFDTTVELHMRLGVDPKHADQNIRDNVVLPSGTGKSVRIAVFGDDADVAKAKQAGADIAAGEEFLQLLDKGEFDFDVLISTPKNMAKLGKYARVLGPKGLMPNPKSGTVTVDVAKAVNEAKGGKVEYRVDSTGIVHLGIGKTSFSKDKIVANVKTVFESVKAAKPSSIKGIYVQSIFLTTTMGPSIKVLTSEA